MQTCQTAGAEFTPESINREVTSKSEDLLLSLHFRCTRSLMANREKYEFTLTCNFTVVTINYSLYVKNVKKQIK